MAPQSITTIVVFSPVGERKRGKGRGEKVGGKKGKEREKGGEEDGGMGGIGGKWREGERESKMRMNEEGSRY